MTAKHRRGKGNSKHEDGSFRNDVAESESRAGGNNPAVLSVLFLLIAIGGAGGAWFCFQQQQTLTHLTDNLMGMQMKIVKLQSSHEEMRQSSSEQHVPESLETRLHALEDSYALAQKQVALATAEQLKTSELPSQVLSLHAEMSARLAEVQQGTVSPEQLSQLQSLLEGKSEEFDGVRVQVDGLAALGVELSRKVEVLAVSVGEAESKLQEGQVAALSAGLDGQAAEVLRLKGRLDAYQAQLEAGTREMAAVRELLEVEASQRLQQAGVEEQLNAPVRPAEEETAPEEGEAAASEEEEATASEEEEAAAPEEEEAAAPEEEEAAAPEEEEAAESEEEEATASEEEDAGAFEEEGAAAPEEEEAAAPEEEEAAAPEEEEASAPEEEEAAAPEEEEAAAPEDEEPAASEEDGAAASAEDEAATSEEEEAAAPEGEEPATSGKEEAEEAFPTDGKQETSHPEVEADEGEKAAAQDEAPVEWGDSATDETAPVEEVQSEEEPEEENQQADEEERDTKEEVEEEMLSEGETGLGGEEEPYHVAAEEETGDEEEPLGHDALLEDE
uniref:Uncharacterized protein n=3 Tax=Gasterosteus aculeatus TaxID=69293 RepID=A0AAQ4QDW3_GASAC|nr:neurofilament medium polypeptide isoform X1 [Gasterosteus aculeatus aculeatus]